MSPLLIDKRQIVTVGIIFFFSIVLFFAGGYLLGYHHASNGISPVKLIQELLSDEDDMSQVLSVDEYSAENHLPEEAQTITVVSDTEQKTSALALASIRPKQDIADKPLEDDAATVRTVSDDKSEETILSKIIDNASEADAKYSIQVGLYGIKVNAERRVEELKDKGLSGHLTDFVNGKGDTLYNVRFGYFSDRESVLAALSAYQEKYTGDGYIIRLKAK